MDELFRRFVQSGLYLRGWSPKTPAVYQRAFSSFQQSRLEHPGTSGETPAISKAQLEAWIVWMQQRGLTVACCNIYIRSINSFLSWLKEEGHPIDYKLRQLKGQQRVIESFSDEEIKRLLAFRATNFTELRTWTLITTLLDTGIRIEECLTLAAADVDLDNLLIKVVGKGNKTRVVPFSLNLRKNLFRYQIVKARQTVSIIYIFCTHRGSKLMYRNCYRDIEKLCRQVGITSSVHPHKFRHTFASNFIKNGGEPFHLKRILGHASLQTTMNYVHLQTADLTAAHQKFGLLSRL